MEDKLTEQLLDLVRNRHYGKYRGKVTDDADPTSKGRVKVQVPAVLGTLEIWAMPCMPYAGNGVGFFTVPEKESGVWVEFEGGDPSFPIYTGGFWAENEVPKSEKNTNGGTSLKLIRSKEGLLVSFDDQSQVLTMSDKDGSNILTLEVQQGKIKIKGKMKVVVEAPQIELVENSTHPVVFGDELLTYLNQVVQIFQTHTHPGELALGTFPVTPAPPVPPLPPPTPSLISQKVKTG